MWNGLARSLGHMLDRAGDEWVCAVGAGKKREEARIHLDSCLDEEQAAFVLWVLSLSACRVFFSVVSRSVISNSMTPRMGVRQAPLSVGIFPGKNTGVSCHFFFQGIFPTQELNLYVLHLLPGRQILHW